MNPFSISCSNVCLSSGARQKRMFQPLGRFSDVAESIHPIRSPTVASRSAVLLESGILCSDFHSRDHWPYCRRNWFFAELSTLARSRVPLAPSAHTFLIFPIHSATESAPPKSLPFGIATRIELHRGLMEFLSELPFCSWRSTPSVALAVVVCSIGPQPGITSLF